MCYMIMIIILIIITTTTTTITIFIIIIITQSNRLSPALRRGKSKRLEDGF